MWQILKQKFRYLAQRSNHKSIATLLMYGMMRYLSLRIYLKPHRASVTFRALKRLMKINSRIYT
jgi:hypothetical protein